MVLQKDVENIMDVTCKLKRKWDKEDTYLESERVEIMITLVAKVSLEGFNTRRS